MFNLYFFLFLVLGFSRFGYSFTCSNQKQVIGALYAEHMIYKETKPEISERTIQSFIRSLDPMKLYFFQSDVDGFMKKYVSSLPKAIESGRCDGIADMTNVYNKHFVEMQKWARELIKSDLDFTVDEEIELDRKKMDYPANEEERKARWRQWIKYQYMQLEAGVPDAKQIKTKLEKRYDLLEKRHNERKELDIYSRFLGGLARSLDPHSDFMPPSDLEDFRVQTGLSLQGIGAVLSTEDGFTVIKNIVPGGPADKQGQLKVEDKITAITDEKGVVTDLIDMELSDVVRMIRGPKGSTVSLTITRASAKGVEQISGIKIVRDEIKLTDNAAYGKLIDVKVPGITKENPERTVKVGVIDLPSFYIDFAEQSRNSKDFTSSYRDLKNEIEKLQKAGMEALVLDLRANGGGSLTESIKIAGMFIDKGPVVQTKDGRGNVVVNDDVDPGVIYDGPLVLHISRQSASASEILAGAMKDYNRAIIVGDDHTFGKGTVQNLRELSPSTLGALKTTVQKFYRPSGASTQLGGVESDIIMPTVMHEIDVGERFQDYALPFERIAPAKYKPLPSLSGLIGPLAARSSQRIKKDEGFKEVQKEILEWKKNADKRTKFSLKKDSKAKKEEKAKEKEAEKAKEKANASIFSRERIVIEDDLYLQESVRIAADYAMLSKKIPLAAMPEIPKKAAAVASKKVDTKKDTGKTKATPAPAKK